MSDKLAWAKALDQLLCNRLDPVPKEWRTPEQLADQMGLCEEMAKIKCKELVKAGLAERKEFRVKWGKMIRPRPHYRLVSPKGRRDISRGKR